MDKKKSEFEKVFSAWDILVIAFGAMIGWGWVVSSGDWIEKGGVIGAVVGFAIGGIMIFFVGLTYAELTSAMPQCGGEHVFSYKAMGPIGSYICTWAIILGYVGVVCFEACALPTIITYICPGFLKGYLYSVAGFDIYATWLAVAIIMAIIITYINIRGAKTAAILQTILTAISGMCGIVTSWNSFLIGGSRAMYSMAESYMIPRCFVKLHKKYKTPTNALYLIGGLSILAPLCGRKMLVWVMDAGNFGCCLAYCMVAISFMILRKKDPDLKRPYKVKNYKLIGAIAIIMSGFMVAMYIIPKSGGSLVWQEWVIVGSWSILGIVFGIACKLKYKEKFASHIDVEIDEDSSAKDEIDMALEALEVAKEEVKEEAVQPLEFSYFLPINIQFGSGKVNKVGELTKPYGKKAIIVTGRSSAKKSGLYDKVNNSLKAAGIDTVLFDKVKQNPLTTTAEEGALFAKENNCDVVVAIGGGSIMDCAKAIAFLSVNNGNINDYIFNKSTSDKALPLVLIPTTCGTGSEGNGFAVLTNPETGDKKSLRTNAIVAKVSIVDPECMMTMPKKVLASVGFDALCHSIEAYTSKIAQPFTDALSLYAISLIADNLVDVYEGKASKEAWEKITLASTIGGMVINTAGVTLAHGMEHPASGLRDIVHGQGLAALTPAVIEASCKGEHFKFAKIARIFGGVTAEDCAPKIRTLLKKLDLECKLSDFGFTEEDIPWMAKNCLKVSAASIKNNPVVFTEEEIEEIYRKAM